MPYRDYFDLKGPVFFFYEALGQFFIRGRNGIFLIQCISIVFTAVFLYKLSREYLNRLCSALVLLTFYFIEFSILWGGNTVEELFMPFNMAALYLTLKYFKNKRYDEVQTQSFALGAGFGVMALSKITVASAIISAVITVVFVLAVNKKWKKITEAAGFYIGGFALVCVPVLCYFGFRNSLHDFFFAVFQFALKRSTDYYEGFSLEWEKSLLIADAAFVFGLLMKGDTEEKKGQKLLIIVTSVVTYLLLHLGTPYMYYFLSLMPLFGLFLVLWMKNAGELITGILEKKTGAVDAVRRAVMVLLIIPAVGFWVQSTVDKAQENIIIRKYEINRQQVEDCIEINELVPEWERDDIFNLESGMIYYEVNRTLPANKYPVNLPYFMHLYPAIKDEVMDKLMIDRPKWIISEYIDGFDDEDVRNWVHEHYELVADNVGEELYRLAEP